jgi:hypothetical protein
MMMFLPHGGLEAKKEKEEEAMVPISPTRAHAK